MTADAIAPYLAFFTDHLYTIVFIAATIDATGFPFPGRLLLITAGALAGNGSEATRVVLSAAAGAFVGDHALYLLGRLGGHKVLSLYCRWTMGSSRCIEQARDYFRRFGGMAIVIGRFVTGVRLFAAALAGSGGIRYSSFVFFDAIGILLWASTFALLGYFLGARAAAILGPYRNTVLVIGIGLALVPPGVVAYRLWRRRRHGPATSPQQSSQPKPAPSAR